MTYPSRILAIDIETTGDVAKYDKLLQVGAVVMEDGQADTSLPVFSSRVGVAVDKLKINLSALAATCGDITTPDGATKVQEWVKRAVDAPQPPAVATEFAVWCEMVGAKDLPVVAHFAHFDHGFIGEWITNNRARFALPPLSPVWICTWTMSKRVWPDERNHGLDDVCKRLGLAQRPVEHDAMQDAILAGAVYDAMRIKL